MHRIIGTFWDGKNKYCAMGAYLRYLGASDEILKQNRTLDVNDYREKAGLAPIHLEDLFGMIKANDEGDLLTLNNMLEKHDIPLRINRRTEEWILINKNNEETSSESFDIFTHLVRTG